MVYGEDLITKWRKTTWNGNACSEDIAESPRSRWVIRHYDIQILIFHPRRRRFSVQSVFWLPAKMFVNCSDPRSLPQCLCNMLTLLLFCVHAVEWMKCSPMVLVSSKILHPRFDAPNRHNGKLHNNEQHLIIDDGLLLLHSHRYEISHN